MPRKNIIYLFVRKLHWLLVLASLVITLPSLLFSLFGGETFPHFSGLLRPIQLELALPLTLIALYLLCDHKKVLKHQTMWLLIACFPVLLIAAVAIERMNAPEQLALAIALLSCWFLAGLFLIRDHLSEPLEIILFFASMAIPLFGVTYWYFSGHIQNSDPLYSLWSPVVLQVFAWTGVTQSRRFKQFMQGIQDSPHKQAALRYLVASPVLMLTFGIVLQLIGNKALQPIDYIHASMFTTVISMGSMYAIYTYANTVATLESEQREQLHLSNQQLHLVVSKLLSEREEISQLNKKLSDELDIESSNLQETVAALRTQRLHTKAANDTRSRFLSVVSHEIRGPLSAILSLSNMIKSAQPEQLDQLTRKLDMATRHLNGLLTDILEMNKLELGKTRLQETAFDLNEHLIRLTEWVAPVAREKGLYLRYENPCTEPCWVMADELRLRQVLLNLINNAVKFTEHGGVTVSLHAVSRTDKHTDIEIRVRDTGPGIKADRVESIFNAFEQEDETTSAKFGGYGLGLAIVKDLIELMKGQIQVDTREGLGSTFIVRLNFQHAAKPAVPVNTEIENRLHGIRILLVDDAALNRDIARWLLEAQGCIVFEAHSGESALQALKENPVDLVLMDLNMPGIGGLQACRQIHEMNANASTKIIGLSGSDSEEEIEAAMQAGMVGYLVKPLNPLSLNAFVGDQHSYTIQQGIPQSA